jgi:hypothetical protein
VVSGAAVPKLRRRTLGGNRIAYTAPWVVKQRFELFIQPGICFLQVAVHGLWGLASLGVNQRILRLSGST